MTRTFKFPYYEIQDLFSRVEDHVLACEKFGAERISVTYVRAEKNKVLWSATVEATIYEATTYEED